GVWDTVGALGIPLRGWEKLTAARHQFHDTELSGSVQFGYHALAIDERREPFEPTLWSWKPKEGQTVEQMWFCGTHSDIGGGFLKRGLSDIPLQWMIDKAQGTGLAFDEPAMQAHPLLPNATEALNIVESAFHRFVLGRNRPIGLRRTGQPDPTQSLHPTVHQRWDKDAGYRPLGLAQYFERIRDPRGGPRQPQQPPQRLAA
ncbi:MAG: phospholipase effector Tle1 domain-containing protein, partial [Dongiaceae bacterium]